jgi:hypothetical protein
MSASRPSAGIGQQTEWSSRHSVDRSLEPVGDPPRSPLRPCCAGIFKRQLKWRTWWGAKAARIRLATETAALALALAFDILTPGSINNVLPYERVKAVDPQMAHIHAGSPILVPFTPSRIASTMHRR